MAAKIIDGKALAAKVREQVREDVAAFAAEHGHPPGLATVLVGEDAASAIYVNGKQKATAEVGMRGFDHRLAADASRDEVVGLIGELNADDEVSGILVPAAGARAPRRRRADRPGRRRARTSTA